jgi:hypothetical protein
MRDPSHLDCGGTRPAGKGGGGGAMWRRHYVKGRASHGGTLVRATVDAGTGTYHPEEAPQVKYWYMSMIFIMMPSWHHVLESLEARWRLSWREVYLQVFRCTCQEFKFFRWQAATVTGTVEHPQMRLALQALQARMERLQRGQNALRHVPHPPDAPCLKYMTMLLKFN